MSSTEPFSEESLPLHNETDNKYGYLVADGKWYEITVGETKIGSDASLCSIVLGDAALSMLHAVIESEGPEDSFIYDANSSSKTKIGKMTLKPQCRYKINDNDTILVGNKIVQYKVVDHKVENLKTESSFNILKLCKSDTKENINIIDEKNANATGKDEKLVLNTGELAKINHVLQKSLYGKDETSNRPNKSCYILASELFNTNIFSQPTQCEIKNEQNESFKNMNKESIDISDDVLRMKTECCYVADTDKVESQLKCYKGIGENIEEITESYLDDSGTFDFVRKSKSKRFLSSLSKSIDDIFELPTQCQSEINNSQKSLYEKDQNFKNCFDSNIFESKKTEKGFLNGIKSKSENGLCKAKNVLHSEDIDSEFFDDGKDEELSEVMRSISPGVSENNDCILKPRKKPFANNGVKELSVPDEIFEIQTQFAVDLSNIKNFNESKSKTLDFKYGESEECKITETNEKGKEQTETEQTLNNSNGSCNLKTEKVKIQNIKGVSRKKLKKQMPITGSNVGVKTDDNISKLDVEVTKIPNEETSGNSGDSLPTQANPLNSENACDGSQNNVREEQRIRRKSVLSDDVVSDKPNDESDSDSEIRFCAEGSSKIGKKIESPLVNVTLNEFWEKRSNCSRGSSNKTLSDLDISEFLGTGGAALESDTEENFIATQGSYLFIKSKSEKLDGKIEESIKKTKSKLDIWKENWQDFIFTQHVSDENRRKSESESTDKTESDIVVVSTKPIPNIEIYEISEASSDGVINIEENSNESESLIKEKIDDESPSSRGPGLAEGDFYEFKCQSPVLLQSNIQLDSVQNEKENNVITNAEENTKKQHEPNAIRVVSDSDETDCEEELKTRELSSIHKFPGFDNNKNGEETFPSTSNLEKKEKKCGETELIAKQNFIFEKRENSPLKRTRRSDANAVLPKKRSKNVRKKKESESVAGRQLRNRGVKACKERFQSDERKENNEIKTCSKKTVLNTKVASRKTLDFVFEKNFIKSDKRASSCCESNWKPSSVNIVYTGFESESHNKIISRLGGLRVNDFDRGNVLVTDKVRRTVKFLSAVALGVPIVSPNWLITSNKELKFLNPWNFLLEDEASEERWGFNLKNSLENWKEDKLLKGFNVFATENTKPPVPEILSIVKCCGGMTFTSYPEVWPEKSIVLTCLEDKSSWPHYRHRSVKIVHYEFLLSGVLKHSMDFRKYKLR